MELWHNLVLQRTRNPSSRISRCAGSNPASSFLTCYFMFLYVQKRCYINVFLFSQLNTTLENSTGGAICCFLNLNYKNIYVGFQF